MSAELNALVASYLNAGKSVTKVKDHNALGARFFNPRNNVLKEERKSAAFQRRARVAARKTARQAKASV